MPVKPGQKPLFLTEKEFIERSIAIHNDKYDYSESEYKNMSTYIIIICKTCNNKFRQQPYVHVRGIGCKRCSDKKHGELYISNTKEFIDKAQILHGDKYNYDKCIYIKSHTKVTLNCSKHGDFLIAPNHHLDKSRKGGCGQCSIEGRRKTQEQYLKEIKEIHKGRYGYDRVKYIKSDDKIEIFCFRCKQYFFQKAKNHLDGKGCGYCKRSKGEILVKSILENLNLNFDEEYKFSDCKHKGILRFDFCIKDNDKLLLIEYQGQQHYDGHFHSPKRRVDIQTRDRVKTEYCAKENIPLLIIPYWDKDKSETLISSFLKENNIL